MNAYTSRLVLLAGMLLLTVDISAVPSLSWGQAPQPQRANEPRNKNPVEPSQEFIANISARIKAILPEGWSIKSEHNIITIGREMPIEWYGTISLPSHRDLADLKAKGFIQSGNYTIILEFFPPMSNADVDKLTEGNRRIEQQYYAEHPQPKNDKPLGLPTEVRRALHHIPNILTKRYSVLVIPFIQGPGLAFFNDQEKKECENVEQDVCRLLKAG